MSVRDTLCVSSLLLLASCAPDPIQPAPPNPFVQRVVVTRVESGDAVGDATEIRVNSGFLAHVSLEPADDIPETLEGRQVEPADLWPICLRIYPRGSDTSSKDAILSFCNKFIVIPPRTLNPPMVPYWQGVMPLWTDSGFDSIPAVPDDLRDDELRFWTYFAVKPDEPGEYVFEVWLFPTAYWISKVRFDEGPPVVLKRGLLRVVDAE